MLLLVLGSGCASLIDSYRTEIVADLSEGQPFKIHPLDGHDRKLYKCFYRDLEPFYCLSGKLHLYEGYALNELNQWYASIIHTFQISSIIITAASGALSTSLDVGNWYSVTDFLCFPQISGITVPQTLSDNLMASHNATYAYHLGPSLGTKAEYQMLKSIGADLIGMSLLPEINAIQGMNLKMACLSVPVCHYFDSPILKEPNHHEVMEVSNSSVPKLVQIINQYIEDKWNT